MMFNSGAKAQILKPLYAALKGRSSTRGVLPQRLKPVLMKAETAGINACSTLRGTANALGKGINACSTPAKTHHGWNLTASAPKGVR